MFSRSRHRPNSGSSFGAVAADCSWLSISASMRTVAKTIWLGLQEIAVFVEGARYARQFDVA
jgi:hypothetical protein